MASFLKTIKDQEELIEFDVDLWCNTIDWIIVKSKKRFLVKFQDRMEERVNQKY